MNIQLQALLDQAFQLVKSESRSENQALDKNQNLEDLKSQIPKLAEQGQSSRIGQIVKALEESNIDPDIRKSLHYFAQSEAERGLRFAHDPEEVKKILSNIAKAFKLANEIDTKSS